jgi:chromosome segregation ATPase
MDVEKTMQFLVEQQGRFDARQAELQAQFEERMTRIESVLLDVATAQERTNAILATLTEQHVELAQSHKELAQSHKELAQSHKKLSEAQQVTAQNLNALIITLERHIANHK